MIIIESLLACVLFGWGNVEKLFTVVIVIILLLSSSMEASTSSRQVQNDPAPISPDQCVKWALADVLSLPVEIRPFCRYLSIHDFKAGERHEPTQVLDFACNSLSKRRFFSFVTGVQGSNGSVVRVVLENYGISTEAWESLARTGSGPVRISKKQDQSEEWFSAQIVTSKKKVTKQRQMKDASGKLLFYDVGKPTEKPAMEDYIEEVVENSGCAPWLDPVAMLGLQTETHSSYPILLGSWFIANALIAPAYQELMGFKTLKDFQETVRFRERDLDLSTKGIVTNSLEVAHNARALLFTPTVLGEYKESFDFFESRGLSNLLKDPLKKTRDAGEIIGTLHNGLQAYLLVDGKNNIIDFADPQVASYRGGAWKNPLVWTGISCMVCHDSGTKSVTDEVRRLSKPPLGLQIPLTEKKAIDETRDLFFSGGVDELVEHAQERYKTKVFQATRGLTSIKNAQLLQKMFVSYWQDTMTLDDAARYVGSTSAELKPLIASLKSPAPDPTLIQLLSGLPVRRDMFLDGGYSQLATIVYNLRKVKP